MALRVASLDNLGVVAARLRRDAVSSQLDETGLKALLQHLRGENGEHERQKTDVCLVSIYICVRQQLAM